MMILKKQNCFRVLASPFIGIYSKLISKKIFLILFCYLCYITGFVLFIHGFISSSSKLKSAPQQTSLERCSEGVLQDSCEIHINICQKFHSNPYQKVIIMIVDALRADFISHVKNNSKFLFSMPYTEGLLKNGSAISFITRGFAPTVTLPRIKSLVTGTISSFLDVLLNFNALELHDDNILKQASLSGLKSVFYGDDTWLKLFPNLFLRSEGTHSFYVSDFKEVDLNVSRHIQNEMIEKDWNILILHFLGVDHIGHAYGPFSRHLPPKLLEMDEIIEFMHKSLISLHPSSLIILCGDHGMTVSGSHGGITEGELMTPLIFLDTVNHKLNVNYKSTVDQVDIAPTLSMLLGLPIPVNSFGKVNPDVLHFAGFSAKCILCAEYNNFLQISNVYKNYFPSEFEQLHFARETIKNHSIWLKEKKNDALNNSDYKHLLYSYDILLTNMKKDLLGISTGYNEYSMLQGLIIMSISMQFSILIMLPVDFRRVAIFKILFMKRYIIFLVTAAACVYSIYLCMMATLIVLLLLSVYQITFSLINHSIENPVFLTKNIFIGFLFIHALSLFSSSFIEEEHQTWYYFTCSFTTLLCYRGIYIYLKTWFQSNSYDVWILKKNCCSLIFSAVSILLLHRIFSKWNQVGNKWQHLPDISDWLNQRENVIFLGLFIIMSQTILMLYFKEKLNKLCYVIFSSGLICITVQKLNYSGLITYFDKFTIANLIPWIIYLCSVVIIIISIMILYTSTSLPSERIKIVVVHFLVAWILLVEVIARAHNIPLITVVIIQEYFLSKILWIQNCDITYNVLCYFIIAMASFSYYGNSNSLSTIDVVTGYTGIQSYRPVIVGFLLFCNTYSTMLIWLVLIPYRIMQFNKLMGSFKSLIQKSKYIFLILSNYKLFILLLYSIIMYLLRHHLFIYSVFFPKLCYEFCHVVFICLINFIISFILDRA